MTTIDGVVVKELVGHADDRQVFREIIRSSDAFFSEGFGQLSYALMHPGTAKAWHVHQRQVDWWYVPTGALKLALYDTRSSSPTHGRLQELLLGPEYGHKVVRIPPGVAHGCRVLGGTTQLFYVTSREYDPADEGRIAHDDPAIGYDWTALPDIR
jgi:dTDP-4-dehydrorhamnose 3,5-epimerase